MNQAHHDDLDDLLAKYSQPELQTDTFEDVHDGDDPGTCVISLMNELLEEALTHKATHIHLYPTKEEFRAAYRIDGLLSQAGSFPDRLKNAIAGRLKVMSQMDLAERRRPQSGRITLVRDAGRASFFVETAPTLHGERITMRILPSVTGPMRLVELGLSEPVYQSLLETLALRQGLFLVAGPTGSGKTTTLYAMLAQLDPHVRSILTIECPPERTLVGIRQMEAVPAMGIDVPLLLRSAARHDPDVLMCSKSHDRESAEMMLQLASTGCLVLGGIHTSDASSAASHLMDIGLEPAFVASSLLGVLGQRLARRICRHCRETYRPSRSALSVLGLGTDCRQIETLWRGRGCRQCRQTGYLGQVLLRELLINSAAIQESIRAYAPAAQIRAEAIQHGMKSFRTDGAQEVLQGETTIEEVLRVTPTHG